MLLNEARIKLKTDLQFKLFNVCEPRFFNFSLVPMEVPQHWKNLVIGRQTKNILGLLNFLGNLNIKDVCHWVIFNLSLVIAKCLRQVVINRARIFHVAIWNLVPFVFFLGPLFILIILWPFVVVLRPFFVIIWPIFFLLNLIRTLTFLYLRLIRTSTL